MACTACTRERWLPASMHGAPGFESHSLAGLALRLAGYSRYPAGFWFSRCLGVPKGLSQVMSNAR